MWNANISENVLSYCVGPIVHAWQHRRITPFIIANNFPLDTYSDTPFLHVRSLPDATGKITYTHNWIRTHTCIVLAQLHIWFLAFRHTMPSSTRLLRVWLNILVKSWHTNNTMTTSHIPSTVHTNRYQINIMAINTNNNIIQATSFDTTYISGQHHTTCLDLLDPTGLPWSHHYDVSGCPKPETHHSLTQGTPALTFSLPISKHAFDTICDKITKPITQLTHNRQRMVIVIIDRYSNRTHFVVAGEYARIPPTSTVPHHYGYSVLGTFYARRGYNSCHTRTDDHQADIFLTFPFAQHTRRGIPTRFDELLLSYQHRPVLTHQNILEGNYSNMNIHKVEILVQRHGTSPMTFSPNTSNNRI